MTYVWDILVLGIFGGAAYRGWQFCGVLIRDYELTREVERKKRGNE